MNPLLLSTPELAAGVAWIRVLRPLLPDSDPFAYRSIVESGRRTPLSSLGRPIARLRDSGEVRIHAT